MSSAPCGHADAYQVTMSVWGCPTCCALEAAGDKDTPADATKDAKAKAWVTYLRSFPLDKPATEWGEQTRYEFRDALYEGYAASKGLAAMKIHHLEWQGHELVLRYSWHGIQSERTYHPRRMVQVLEDYS